MQSWPEAAQEELAAVVNEIEVDFQSLDYVASQDELLIIDAAIASIDAGDSASQAEIAAVFAKFKRA